jgi:hypothetical protein
MNLVQAMELLNVTLDAFDPFPPVYRQKEVLAKALLRQL